MPSTSESAVLITTDEAAAILRVSAQWVRHLARAGDLTAVRGSAGEWLISADSVRAYKQPPLAAVSHLRPNPASPELEHPGHAQTHTETLGQVSPTTHQDLGVRELDEVARLRAEVSRLRQVIVDLSNALSGLAATSSSPATGDQGMPQSWD